MTAELARGQNHPLPGGRLEILVSAGTPVIAGATLNDERGRMRDARWCAHPASPRLPGVEVLRQAAAEHRLTVDPAALPQDVHRVNVLLALPEGPGGPARFAGLPAPFLAVTGPDGTVLSPARCWASATNRPWWRWSCTAGRARGKSAPWARGMRRGSPRCWPTRGCRTAGG
ncbi:hypothetical protein SCA03_42780 [Streptomyces cacaoi]|uniref:Uncharacterized protein n=1 Tax=Streptomyces cacaoi TaxID=1898 RepID=A0A4Y3R4C5_STRCI|nr:hypothetical protein SCA03_42780 [Streptomyces cacaoi]